MLININSEHPNQIEANLPVHRYSSNLSDRIVRQSAPLILGPVTSWIASLAQLKICALQGGHTYGKTKSWSYFFWDVPICQTVGHPLHKTLNRNTIKISYRCLPNMGRRLSKHN